MRLRIRFSKTGPMRYISHLDTMRFFQKALRRAGADVSLSEGFSPHMLMSFALPLSLGMESVGEYFDVEVRSAGSTRQLMEELNRQMCPGCEILSVRIVPDDKAGKCMTQVAAADYSVFVRESDGSPWKCGEETVREKIRNFLSQPEITVLKKTKKGEKEADIKPLIHAFDYNGSSFEMRIGAGSVNHVRCDLLMSAFFAFSGIREESLITDIRRDDLLLENGNGFAPLDSVGEETEQRS